MQKQTKVTISKNAHKFTFNLNKIAMQCNIKCTQNSTINATVHITDAQYAHKILHITNISYSKNKLNYTINSIAENMLLNYTTQHVINIVLNTLLYVFNTTQTQKQILVNYTQLNY